MLLSCLNTSRAAIEDGESRDQYFWSKVAHFCYHKAAENKATCWKPLPSLCYTSCPSLLDWLLLKLGPLSYHTLSDNVGHTIVLLLQLILDGSDLIEDL